jgi:hypothetical protein
MCAAGIALMLILNFAQADGDAATEATDAVDVAREDLAQRLGIEEESIDAHLMWPVVWPDTSLGVRDPDMMYAQVLVPGSVVLLKVGEELFEYHTSDQGRAVYAGPYIEPPQIPASPLIEDPTQVEPGRVAVEGMLVRTRDGAVLYDELVDPENLPTDVLPVLVLGNALQPFIERRWADLENPASWVRIEGWLEVRGPNEPGAGWGRQGDLRARLRADRIHLLAVRGRVPGVLTYEQLVANPGAYDQMLVTVRGELTSGFEVSALGPEAGHQPDLPATWVGGKLDGLPRAIGGPVDVARVEISGLFEARPRGAYGHMGAYACRLTAHAAYALSSILDYPTLMERADALSGRLVTVRGLLLLGGGMSDLTTLTWSAEGEEPPACLVMGDLSGLAEQADQDAGSGLPVQIHGRFEQAEEGAGFGRDHTRRYRLESVFARALEPAELSDSAPTVALAALTERIDGWGDLVTASGVGSVETLAEGLVDFALAPPGTDWAWAAVRPQPDGMALFVEGSEREPKRLAEAADLRMPAWSPDGAALAAIADDEVIVLDVATGERIATGQTGAGAPGRIVEIFWDDAGQSLAFNILDSESGNAATLSLSLAILDTTVLHPAATIFGLLPEAANQACYMGPAEGPGGGTLLAGDCPTCGTQNEPLFDVPTDERLIAYAQHPARPLGLAALASATEPSAPVRVYLVATGGSGARRLVYSGAQEIRYPRWSEGGETFAFMAMRDGEWRAVLMGADARPLLHVSKVLPTVPGLIDLPPAN